MTGRHKEEGNMQEIKRTSVGVNIKSIAWSSQGKNTGGLSELSTMTCLSWVALHGMACSFIELDKAVVHVIRLVSFL